MTSRPWISVVMPTWNGARYVRQALDSLVAQADPGIELVVVDDGSTDGTPEIVDSYRDRLDLRILRRPRAANWVASTNVGVAAARGEHLSILHQDDWWLPGRVEALRRLSARFPRAEAMVHAARFTDSTGRTVGRTHSPFRRGQGLFRSEDVLARLFVQNFVALPTMTARRSALDRIGPMDERLWYTADWKHWLALATTGPWAYSPAPLVCLRLHVASLTLRGSRDLADIDEQLRSVQEEFLPALARCGADAARTARVGRVATRMNVALAARFHGKPHESFSLLLGVAALGPVGCWRLARDSHILERALPRLRARLRPADGPVAHPR